MSGGTQAAAGEGENFGMSVPGEADQVENHDANQPAEPEKKEAPEPPPDMKKFPAPDLPRSERPRPEPEEVLVAKRELNIVLNGKPMVLPPKENGQPYYIMDLLEHSGVDFEKLEGPVHLAVNGKECGFSQAVKNQDYITIR